METETESLIGREGAKKPLPYINSKKRSVGISEEYILLLVSKRNCSEAQW